MKMLDGLRRDSEKSDRYGTTYFWMVANSRVKIRKWPGNPY